MWFAVVRENIEEAPLFITERRNSRGTPVGQRRDADRCGIDAVRGHHAEREIPKRCVCGENLRDYRHFPTIGSQLRVVILNGEFNLADRDLVEDVLVCDPRRVGCSRAHRGIDRCVSLGGGQVQLRVRKSRGGNLHGNLSGFLAGGEHQKELSGEERDFYDYMLAHPFLTYEEALMELRPELAGDDFVRHMQFLGSACAAVRGHFRNLVVKKLLEAGVRVDVYGKGWEEFGAAVHADATGLVLHPEVSVDESLAEMKKAKLSLNITSWHKAGMTERIANSMLCGTVCVSEETSFLREHMKDGEDILLFRLDELDSLGSRVKELLADEERRERIARQGYEKASTEFTWEARAQALLELSEKHFAEVCG